jgi:hypothetical protein
MLVISRYITIQSEFTRHNRWFNTEGRELTALPSISATRHFADSIGEIFQYSLRDLQLDDMVGISIHNEDNQQ